MGLIGDEENGNRILCSMNTSKDIIDAEARPNDRLSSPRRSTGGLAKSSNSDDVQYMQNTAPVDDSQLDDAFETEPVTLARETQAVDDGETQVLGDDCTDNRQIGETQVLGDDCIDNPQIGETQVLDDLEYKDKPQTTQAMYIGETQVLDDLDCMVHAQLLDECGIESSADSDDEGTDKPEELCDTQELSDDDSGKRDHGSLVGLENMADSGPCEKDDCLAKGRSGDRNEIEPYCGTTPGGFTSVRAASIRASGLAARITASRFKLGNSSPELRIIEDDEMSLGGNLMKSSREMSEELSLEYKGERKEPRDENRCKVGNRTVRKLFTDHRAAETVESDMYGANFAANVPGLLASENVLAGLSYANSQEPGESSQANALEVVDNFLKINVFDDQDIGFGGSTVKKSMAITSTNGIQSLAKSATLKRTNEERGTFDWDDTHEDEGGGDFFLKKKELLFDNGGTKCKSLSKHLKRRSLDSSRIGIETEDREEQAGSKKKLKSSVHSDSRLMVHKVRRTGELLNANKENLRKDLEEVFNEASEDKGMDDAANNSMLDMMNIGPDTQMAAEAMENLCFEMHLAERKSSDLYDCVKGTRKASSGTEAHHKTVTVENFSQKRVKKAAKQTKANSRRNGEMSPSLAKQPHNIRKQRRAELQEAVPVVAEPEVRDAPVSQPPKSREQKKRGSAQVESASQAKKKLHLEDRLGFVTPVAHRTRSCGKLNGSKSRQKSSSDYARVVNNETSSPVPRKRRILDPDVCKTSSANNKNFVMDNAEKSQKRRSDRLVQSDGTRAGTCTAPKFDMLRHPTGCRSQKKLPLTNQEANGLGNTGLKKSRIVTRSTSEDPGINQANCIPVGCGSVSPSVVLQSKQVLPQPKRKSSRDNITDYGVHVNGQVSVIDEVEGIASRRSDGKIDAEMRKVTEQMEANGKVGASPSKRCDLSGSECTTPVTCKTPSNDASPICIGDGYRKQSCRKNLSRLSLMKELNSLLTSGPGLACTPNETRRRKDMTSVRVLFSRHLDLEVIKQQKKVLARLGASVVSSMSDSTHFIADEFVRTRNMLEAIALGKPVVTPLWIESCGQASCFIDERNYILRDTKKEKEFGFSMPVSLARACQHPLLQGQKVLVTPNAKPSKEIVASLVKAVRGLAVERLGRSVWKDDKFPDDILVLSSEEDYDICVPFLERGGAIYSSELLLNGIVIQKLEYERHRLFTDHVKQTRSTIWLKKQNQYVPVTKTK